MGFEACGGDRGCSQPGLGCTAFTYLLKGIQFQRLGLLLSFIIIGMNDGLKGRRRGGDRSPNQ